MAVSINPVDIIKLFRDRGIRDRERAADWLEHVTSNIETLCERWREIYAASQADDDPRLVRELLYLQQAAAFRTLEHYALQGVPRLLVDDSEQLYEALSQVISTRQQLRSLIVSFMEGETPGRRARFYALLENLHQEAGALRGVVDTVRRSL